MDKKPLPDLSKCCYGTCESAGTVRGTIYSRDMQEYVVSACFVHAKLDSFFPFVDGCKSEEGKKDEQEA